MPCSPRVFQPVTVFLFLLTSVSSLPAQTFSTLVNITPCRVMDTRNPNGPFGGPFIKGSSTRNVPIPNSSCQIPSNAVAYSLNVTVIPHGTLYFITVWPAGQAQPNASTLNSFQGYVIANAAIVPAGAGGAISVYASGDTDLIVDINGYYTNMQLPVVPPPVTIPTFPTVVSQSSIGFQSTAVGVGASSAGTNNVALGYNALLANAGNFNTAVGVDTLKANLSQSNSAFGSGALASNSNGSENTATGALSMSNNAGGSRNSAFGAATLQSNGLSSDNTGVGYFALNANTSGGGNTAVGSNALQLYNAASASGNIALGFNAGSHLKVGDNNIYIGNRGTDGDYSKIRIGSESQSLLSHQSTYLLGTYYDNYVGGSAVYITNDGKLGTNSSSRRYKEDIQEIGMVSDKLYQLRPVQFRYKKPADDGTKPIQFGLIAEEVANVYPELVIHNKDGQIEGLQYQQLPALLLNEIQKQQRTLAFQNEQIRDLTARVAALEAPASKTASAPAVQQ